MKEFFISQKYFLKTGLSSQQVCDLIADNTDQLDYWRLKFLSDHNNEFESKVSSNAFEVRKIGSYRTSLLVFAKGVIEEHGLYTDIKINIRPSLSAILFHSVWLSLVTIVFIVVLWVGLTRNLMALLFLFIPGIMLFLSSRNISFRRESEDVKKFLTHLLDINNR